MVNTCRVDHRLIHGQVAVTWINSINPDAIVVANDEVMKDDIALYALKMAKPEGMKMAIRSTDDAITLINDPKTKGMNLYLVVKNTDDALKVLSAVNGAKNLNIGGLSNGKNGGEMISKGVFVTKKDLENIKNLLPYVEEVDTRIVPSDTKKDILNLLNE